MGWAAQGTLFFAGAGPGAMASADAPSPPWALPQPGHGFRFPADNGAHPEFKIEWWYVTGHLFTPTDRRFGFQATFFRFAGPPGKQSAASAFSSGELHLAHMALTDVATGKYLNAEHLNRKGWDADSAVGHLDVHNSEWSLSQIPDSQGADPVQGAPNAALRGTSDPVSGSFDSMGTAHSRFVLRGGIRADASFALTLSSTKPLVVFGQDGVSRKSAEASAASYYLTFSRLRVDGTLDLAGESFPVHGLAWMDHEISSSQLGSDQVGWDWVCIQLKATGRELMLYRMRRSDGTADPFSILQWVTPDGRAVKAPFQWEVLSRWKSPRSGALYPSRVRLSTADPATGTPVVLEINPLVADQELANDLGGGPYWEGACSVLDPRGLDIGSAYLELTGYAKALKF